MQRHLSHQSLFPLSVKVNHSACTEWADDLQIKNKSAVSWPLNADLSIGGQMYLYFFHAGETLVSYSPYFPLPEITPSKGQQLFSAWLKDTDPGSFFPALLAWRVLTCHGPHSRKLKMSPQPWTILLCQDLPCGVGHMGSNPLRVQG